MQQPSSRPRVLLLLAAVLFVTASCGGKSQPMMQAVEGDDVATTTSPTGPGTAGGPPPTAPGTAPANPAASDAATTVPYDAPNAFCAEMGHIRDLSAAGAVRNLEVSDGNLTPEQLATLKQGFADMFQAAQRADAVAPPEIAADVHTLSQTYAKLSNAIAAATSASDVFSALAGTGLDPAEQQRATTATSNVGAYVERVCGFDLGSN